jgi:hypothetical protein
VAFEQMRENQAKAACFLKLYLQNQLDVQSANVRCMMKSGAMVTYKELSLKLTGCCGLVEGNVQENPDMVLVRWVGDTSRKVESVRDLEEI